MERIISCQVPRPHRELIQQLLGYEGLTPTLSDILDSLGVAGAIPGSLLKPDLQGKKIAGPAVTRKYVSDRLTPVQSFHDKAKAKLADRDAYRMT